MRHAIGAKFGANYIGANSKFATFSFNGNKVITGGAVAWSSLMMKMCREKLNI